MTLSNGHTAVKQGTAVHSDLRLVSSFDDWVDVFAGREDARKLVLARRLRPRGDLRLFMKLEKIFG